MSIDLPVVAVARRRLWLWVGLLLAAAWLRTPALFANGMRPDEALYATWARLIYFDVDRLLQDAVVDKPPLLFYLQAALFALLQPADFSARLPSWIGSLLSLPLLLQTAAPLVGRRTALFAVIMTIIAPLAIQFSATALIDPLLITLLLAAFAIQLNKSTGTAAAAGLLLGLALTAKYTALLLLPLVVLAAVVAGWDRRSWLSWLVALSAPLLLLAVWQLLSGNGASFAATGDAQLLRSLRPIATWELGPRLAGWLQLLQTITIVPFWLPLLAAFLIVLRRGRQADRLLMAVVLLYLALHWLLAVAQYDRYLYLLLPLLAVLFGRALQLLLPTRGGLRHATLIALLLLLLPSALRARSGQYAVGSWPHSDDGAAAVQAIQSIDGVVYDHWYSWQLRYYLFGGPLYVAWVPHPAALIDDLAVFYDDARFLALPDDRRARPFRQMLNDAGYRLDERLQSGSVTLYKIERYE